MQRFRPYRFPLGAAFALSLTFSAAPFSAVYAQSGAKIAEREAIPGVVNFGRVTDKYFRGGAVTPEGVNQLAARGVRTIVDLRDKPSPGEAEAAAAAGIKYHKFPMNGHASPDPAVVEEVLGIIRDAKAPVYVHCSAGKHRAGTICALYRMREQNWTPERAWAEQQSYGFGMREEHPELYAYAYEGGSTPRPEATLVAVRGPRMADDDEERSESRKSKKKDDDDDRKASKKSKDDDDDDDDARDVAKGSKKDDDDDDDARDVAKRSKKDDDDDDDARDAVKRSKSRGDDADEDDLVAVKAAPAVTPIAEASIAAAPAAVVAEDEAEETDAVRSATVVAAAPTAAASLSPDAKYIPLSDALKRARAHGGSGDTLKIDLEYDPLRGISTWDVTFATGLEVEMNATTGAILGSKQKAAAKLNVLTPLRIESAPDTAFRSFASIIRDAQASAGKVVTEMELKRIKGRDQALFEIVFSDGTTVYMDAVSGETVTNL